MTNKEKHQEALARARSNKALSNYPAIIRGFMERGIPQHDIKPRDNVLTYDAWRALGKQVLKGEHGIKIITWIPTETEKEDPDTGKIEIVTGKRPWTATVFHESQVQAIG